MPPPIPRAPICSLQRPLASRSTTSTSRCCSALLSRSQFSTTSPANNGRIPPESPKFIPVPEPPQSSEVRLPPIKGHLPVPRQVFSKRDGARKVAPGYIEKTVPRGQAELVGEAPRNDLEAWRRRMAESRRQSLAAGLKGLYRRKERTERIEKARSKANFEANRRAAMAPEGLDDVFTRATVPAAAALNEAMQPDPARFERAEQSAAATAARRQAASEARRDALSELYISAKDFIITEKELEETVEKIFTEDYFRKLGSVAIDSSNIWDARGSPITIAGMVSAVNRTQTNLVSSAQSEATRTAKRQKIVAEELTGGKMP